MQQLFHRKNQMIAICLVFLIIWTAWCASVNASRETPHGKCVVRQTRLVVDGNGVTRKATLSTSFWLDARRVHVHGCFQQNDKDLSIDRSGSLQTVFAGQDSLLGLIKHVFYSPDDMAISQSLPDVLPGVGEEIALRFRKLTADAWIVETGDDRAGMCVASP